VNSLPKTVTQQRRGRDLNPGPTAPESSTLTTRLPSHQFWLQNVLSRHKICLKILNGLQHLATLYKLNKTRSRCQAERKMPRHGRTYLRTYIRKHARKHARTNGRTSENIMLAYMFSRIDSRKDVHGRWTSLKTYSLLVLSAARKDQQELELVHQH